MVLKNYRPPSAYAKKTREGWRAGPASEKYGEGQFVPESYAHKVRRAARREQLVSNIMVERDDLTVDEARDQAEKFLEQEDEVKEETEGRPEEREAELARLRRRILYGN